MVGGPRMQAVSTVTIRRQASQQRRPRQRPRLELRLRSGADRSHLPQARLRPEEYPGYLLELPRRLSLN
jgi:hypothetical protein